MSTESSPNPGAGKSCCGCLVIVVVFLFIIGSCGALFSGSDDEDEPVEEDAVVETDAEDETEPVEVVEVSEEEMAAEWAQQVESQWKESVGVQNWADLGSDSIMGSIKKVSSDDVGTLRVDMGSTGYSSPEVGQWGDGVDSMINLSLTDTEDVYTVYVYVNGERASSSETTSGLDEVMARMACERHMDTLFPYGSKAHWILDNNGASIAQNGTVWQLGVGATVQNAYGAELKYEIVCLVGGSNENAQVVDFEVR